MLSKDPTLLLEKCPDFWEPIMKHEIDEDTEKIISENVGIWGQQHARNTWVSVVNMDNHTLRVEELPYNSEEGRAYTKDEFYQHFRKNLQQYASSFHYYNEKEDKDRWNSDKPKGTVFSIDLAFIDDGSVACTDITSESWIFTTITTPKDKTHAVSGHRQFGIEKNDDGSFTIFTRGVDGVNTIENLFEFFGLDVYEKGQKFWKNMFDNVKSDIDDNGGKSDDVNMKSNRVAEGILEEILDGTKDLTDLKDKCN